MLGFVRWFLAARFLALVVGLVGLPLARVTLLRLVPFLPGVGRALTLSQRLFVRRRVPCLACAVSFPQTSSVVHLCHLRPFALRPSCCYRLRTCITPSLLHLLPSSAISHCCLPIGLPLPPLVSPFTSPLLFVCIPTSVARRLLDCAGRRPGLVSGCRDVRLLRSVY